jgi:hypothetical protein
MTEVQLPRRWAISTSRLKHTLANVPDSHEKKQFLKELPLSSTYEIENSITPWGITGIAFNPSTHHHDSNTPIRWHLELRGLTERYTFMFKKKTITIVREILRCQLGLSEDQALKLKDLVKT